MREYLLQISGSIPILAIVLAIIFWPRKSKKPAISDVAFKENEPVVRR